MPSRSQCGAAGKGVSNMTTDTIHAWLATHPNLLRHQQRIREHIIRIIAVLHHALRLPGLTDQDRDALTRELTRWHAVYEQLDDEAA